MPCAGTETRALFAERSAEEAAPAAGAEAGARALLIACARVRIEPGDAERIAMLAAGEVDWDYLVRIAIEHGVAPLLYRSLLQCCPNRMPADAYTRLQHHCRAGSFLNLVRTRELLSILDLFQRHGIHAIPIKGPFLATVAYGDLSLRDFSDLDLLVDRPDVQQAEKLLTEEGFTPDPKPEGWRRLTVFLAEHHLGFNQEAKKLRVELHWAVTPLAFRYPVHFQELTAERMPVECGSQTVDQLSLEELLILLCVHGSKHRWLMLKWICDIAELVRSHPELQWDVVRQRADARGVRRMVLLGLYLAEQVLGAALPEPVRAQIRTEPHIAVLGSEVQELLFSPTVDDESELYRWRFHLRMRERAVDRLLYMAACVVLYNDATNISQRDRAFLPITLPPALTAVYYLIRPVRVAVEYARWRLGNAPKRINRNERSEG